MAYKDGLPLATNLFEAAVWHKAIKVTCGCGHAVTYDPHGLWWLFERKGWDMRFMKRVVISPAGLASAQGEERSGR